MAIRKKLSFDLFIGSLLSTLVFFTCVVKIQPDFLRIPLVYDGDAFFGLFFIQELIRGEWNLLSFIQSQFAGAPFGMHFGDYPIAERLHLFLLKLISFFIQTPGGVLNFFYFLGFPLSTMAFIYLARSFRVPRPMAVATGILFAFLPYHLRRYAHYFLASYFLLPLMLLVILWSWNKKPLFFAKNFTKDLERNDEDKNSKWKFTFTSKKAVFSLITAFLAGMAGTYYAFFFCLFLGAAGISAFFYRQNFRHFVSASLVIGVTTASLGLSLAPHFIYWSNAGSNPEVARRGSAEAEANGLKLIQMVLPQRNHRIPEFAKIRERYRSTTPIAEGYDETIGIVGLIGFLILLFRMILIGTRKTVFDRLSLLLVIGILVGTYGGLGSLFAAAISPQIRCYNRISIYLALICLFAVGLASKTVKKQIGNRGIFILSFALLAFGCYDQITPDLQNSIDANRKNYISDKTFIAEIESISPGGLILQLPYMKFPESPPIEKMTDYSHFVGPLFSDRLRWSYGRTRGRFGADQIEKVSEGGENLNLMDIAAMGYSGIFINRNGFQDHGQKLEQELIRKTEINPIVSPNETLSFFSFKGPSKGPLKAPLQGAAS